PLGVRAAQEGVGGLLEIESFLPHAMGEPVMLVETDTGGKGEVGAEADKHPAPAAIVDVKVILHDPALRQLQMPSVVLFVADGGQDACWFSCLQDDDHLVRFGITKIGLDKVVASTFGSFQDGGVPFLATMLPPVVELISDFSQHIPAHRVLISIGAEESDYPLGLLERLNDAVEQNPIKAAISESNAILVMLEECVHGKLLWGETPRA